MQQNPNVGWQLALSTLRLEQNRSLLQLEGTYTPQGFLNPQMEKELFKQHVECVSDVAPAQMFPVPVKPWGKLGNREITRHMFSFFDKRTLQTAACVSRHYYHLKNEEDRV